MVVAVGVVVLVDVVVGSTDVLDEGDTVDEATVTGVVVARAGSSSLVHPAIRNARAAAARTASMTLLDDRSGQGTGAPPRSRGTKPRRGATKNQVPG